jgi:hypothetical protein
VLDGVKYIELQPTVAEPRALQSLPFTDWKGTCLHIKEIKITAECLATYYLVIRGSGIVVFLNRELVNYTAVHYSILSDGHL